ncbi:hypothetical protein [Aliikangiella sp. IMCC44632]
MYPIVQLVMHELQTTSLYQTRRKLASCFSTSSRGKAFKRADAILAGNIKLNMAGFLADSLKLEVGVVEQAIKHTWRIKEEKARLDYYHQLGPHIRVETRGPVTQITFAAMCYHKYRILKLQREIVNWPIKCQLKQVRQKIKTHQLDNPKPLSIFGEIEGYCYCPDAFHSYPLNRSGELTGLNSGPGLGNPVSISIGGKPINSQSQLIKIGE